MSIQNLSEAPLLPQQKPQPTTITIHTANYSGRIWSFFSVLLTVGAGGAAIFFLDKDGVEDPKTTLSGGICGAFLLNSLFRDLFPLFFSRTKEIQLDQLNDHPTALITAVDARTCIKNASEQSRELETVRSRLLVTRKAKEFNDFVESLNITLSPLLVQRQAPLDSAQICSFIEKLGSQIQTLTKSLETKEKELEEREKNFTEQWTNIRSRLVTAEEELKTLKQSQTQNNEEQELRTQISELQVQIKELEGAKETLENKLIQAQEQVEKIQQGNSQENGQLQLQISHLETEIQDLSRTNETYVTTKEALERDLAAAQEQLKKVQEEKLTEIHQKEQRIKLLEGKLKTAKETAKTQLEAKRNEIEELKGKIQQANTATDQALKLAEERQNNLSNWETYILRVTAALKTAYNQALDPNNSFDSTRASTLKLPKETGPLWDLVSRVNEILGYFYDHLSTSAPSSAANTPVKPKGVAFNLGSPPADPFNDSSDIYG